MLACLTLVDLEELLGGRDVQVEALDSRDLVSLQDEGTHRTAVGVSEPKRGHGAFPPGSYL